MNNYSVENYIRDIRKVVNEEVAEKSITERIKPLALRLAAVSYTHLRAHET